MIILPREPKSSQRWSQPNRQQSRLFAAGLGLAGQVIPGSPDRVELVGPLTFAGDFCPDLSARLRVPDAAWCLGGIRLMATHLGFGVVIFSPAGDRTCQMLRTS